MFDSEKSDSKELEREAKRLSGMLTFRYSGYNREEGDVPKIFVPIAKTDVTYCGVQVLYPESKINLHSHAALDQLWYVISGRVRFYTNEGLVGEFGPNEGAFIPRGTAYRLETAGDGRAEILQSASIAKDLPNTVVDYERSTRSDTAIKVARAISSPAKAAAAVAEGESPAGT
jgi:mannose-6-phosphate isomerase-like protein (cupin superfamily)